MNKSIILNDKIDTADSSMTFNHSNPFFRTQVIAGYDYTIDDMGVSRFGEVIFEKENMTLIGGSVFTLEKLFGVRMNQANLSISQLSDYFTDNSIAKPSAWSSHATTPLTADNVVCLFGVGIGGSNDSIGSVKDVKFYQRNIDMMIPLRQVDSDSDLSANEHSKYWCRSESNGLISYYLKKFDNVAINCKWRDSDNEAEGSNVTDGYHNTSPTVTTPIETYVELTLHISKNDIREYFENHDNIEQARLNTIGLFTGVPKELAVPINVGGGIQRTHDYDQVTCFSALNFDNEPLILPKDLTIVYRIFTK